MRGAEILCSTNASNRFVGWKLIEDSVGETMGGEPYGPFLAKTIEAADARAYKLNVIYNGALIARALTEEELQQITYLKLKNVRYQAW